MSTELTTSPSAIAQMSSRLSISQANLMKTLKATVFKECRTDEEFAALVVVANEYQLNPLTKEIYAFPAKGGGVVPIVSIDGWLRIINSHPMFDGMDEEFGPNGESCTITIFRKDRSHPTKHTEWLEEVRRNTEPWKQHTRRMLKWKTIIQAGRIAFGFGGIYDEDEGRDVAGNMRPTSGRVVEDNPFDSTPEPKTLPAPPEEEPSQEVEEQPSGVTRAFYAGHKVQESGPAAKKPWKLWKVSLDVPDSPSIEASTFSETLGTVIEMLEDGDEVEVLIEEGSRGPLIKQLSIVEGGSDE